MMDDYTNDLPVIENLSEEDEGFMDEMRWLSEEFS